MAGVSKSSRYLFFDTETSGLPRIMDAPVARLENWPRVIQLAWILTDFRGRIISQQQHLIRPTGWRMQPGALRVHGISLRFARQHGRPLVEVLQRFAWDLLQTDSIIGHNVQFDQKILGAEFLRVGQTNPLQKRHAQCTMRMGATFLQRYTSLQEAPTEYVVSMAPATAAELENSHGLELASSVETGANAGLDNSVGRRLALDENRVDGYSVEKKRVEGATWRDSKSGFRYPSLRRLYRTLFGQEFENAHDAAADTRACMSCFFEMCR